MNNKFLLAAAIAVLLLAFALFYMQFSLNPGSNGNSGFFSLNLSCNNNGGCNPGETYSDCPNDCCEADCSANIDAVCHSACGGYASCTSFITGCDGVVATTKICTNATTWAQCCNVVPPTSCSPNQYCSSGNCIGCSTACNGLCESSGCYGIDPDCDVAGNPTLACCGNGSCSGAETCVSCPSDCPGSVVCDSNSDCLDDGNSSTFEICSSPGACNSSCSFCVIPCSSDAACNDGNSSTTDACANPGTCSSSCSHSACSIACSSNAACNDSNSLTTDICSNPGTCSSSCSHSACSIACSSNAACNDSNASTTDICTNLGTCSASCSHTPVSSCTVACDSNSACSDSVATTRDVCSNSGTCSSSCSNPSCTIACLNDASCDDGIEITTDYCFSGGTCDAECVFRECQVACIANSGCDDSVAGTADICSNPGACDAACSNIACTISCSSDSQCNDNDALTEDSCASPGTCASSCKHVAKEQLLLIKISPDFNASFARGQSIMLSVNVTDKLGSPVSGAIASLTDSKGNKVLFEDKGNGIYSAVYAVPADFPLGKQDLLLLVSKDGKVGSDNAEVSVQSGPVRAVLVSPAGPLKAAPGEKLEFKFMLVYDGNSIAGLADANAVLNGIPIPLIKDSNGSFVGNYFFSEADAGTALLSVNAWDSFGNAGITEFAFEVASPFNWFWLILIVLLLAAFAICIYGLKKTHKLSSLIGRIQAISLQRNVASFQHGSAKGKKKDALAKKIEAHETEIEWLKKEAACERRKQALAVSKLPLESKYAAHKAAVSASMLPKKLGSIFASKESPTKIKAEKRIGEIDAEIAKIKELIQNLEAEYCKQTIKEDFFREKLFDYREKMHVLELEKKKLE